MAINVSKITKATKLLLFAFRNYKKQFLVMTILGTISGFFESIGIAAVIPLFYLMTNTGQSGTDIISRTIQNFFSISHIPLNPPAILIFILLLFCAKAVVYVIARYVNTKVTGHYEEDARKDLFSRTMHASWSFILNQKGGQLESIILYDIEKATSILGLITGLILTFTTFLTYAFVAFSISAKTTLAIMAIGIILFFIYKPIFYGIRKLFQEVSRLQKESNHHVGESIAGAKTIKSAAVEKIVINKASDYFDRLRRAKLSAAIYKQSTVSLIEPLGFAVIAFLFITTYHSPSFNIAPFAVIMYLIQRMFNYFKTAQNQIHSINEAVPYLGTMLNYRKNVVGSREIWNGDKHFSLNKEIEFRNIVFGYVKNRNVLSSLNFTIKKGCITGIIGISGAGKTTITDLLLRLFRPIDGKIFVDGIDLEDIDINDWRKNIGYVSQDIFLMNESIENNIRFYNDKMSQADIITAAKAANIYETVQLFPEKFKTIAGERGVKLSGGQRQRIALARALARNPKLLILDEATSSIDNESEQLIQESIQNLKGRTTIIIIAHRSSSVMQADNLLVLKNGQIVEQGKPSDLLNNETSYFAKIN
ncbi:MAG: hypothetical protein A2915_03045 [Candidatus Yanofskybacteria bacterium RIFCSPLOWO2_01_FULL_41_34]|uniref:ABC transporter ATP-binding protein n=1 Tax=Candidatus Yanofskybacteria bacterium RIFCSPHIGHO2_01_FULL_41_26 TaxID=1802661 RepID=A0A1F8EFV9_9BACT|nr:MAG: hypothetical protein A2649_00940 [Candidatus Yanofskybacteria bacterium RIFCSPHIGHO2_01_FULL_41_26]OGN21011.1 MAG: hypothetical protein A2915_03045 [Candidatus Yanofskybacteria bacterium RIFCSPLOWO2_01_FULL_41_34]